MSLLPVFDDYLDYFRPRLLDPLLDDDDFLLTTPYLNNRRARRLLSSPYTRPWRSKASHKDSGSTVSVGKDKFQVALDVQQFKPDEITVKAHDNTITVEGKHEEREDEHGYVSRHFVRRYVLPKGHNIEKVESKLSSDGVLTITAPKFEDSNKGRVIPITFTNEPSKAIQNSEEKREVVTPEKPEAKRRKKN